MPCRYAGREGFIPRGYDAGVIRMRWAGHALLLVGALAPHASRSPFKARTPYGLEGLQRFFFESRWGQY
eukprot:1183066-Prorocentrum_minimum.AAC.1